MALYLAALAAVSHVYDGPVPLGSRRRAASSMDDNWAVANDVFYQYVTECPKTTWAWADDLDHRYLAVYVFSSQKILMNRYHQQKLETILGCAPYALLSAPFACADCVVGTTYSCTSWDTTVDCARLGPPIWRTGTWTRRA